MASGVLERARAGPPRSGRAVPAPRLRDEAGVRFAVANAVVALAVPVAAPGGDLVANLALVVVAGVASARLTRRTACVMGALAWAWATGFAENRYGVLTLSPADLARLGASALGGLLVALLWRRATAAAHWSRGRSTPSRQPSRQPAR